VTLGGHLLQFNSKDEKGASETYIYKMQCIVEETPNPAVDASSLDNT
jgi:hypothetical protein